MNIIIEKDRHMRSEIPFFIAHQQYNDWFLNQEWNNEENIFISLGDYFDKSKPTPDEYEMALSFFNKTKFKKIILLAGNHDYDRKLESYSIEPLASNKRIEIITYPEVQQIENMSFAFLPYYYDYSNSNEPMKEAYTLLTPPFVESDFVLYHFEDQTISFGKEKTGIDISYLKGKKIGGHIHKSQKNYELGMPVLWREDEKGESPTLGMIKTDKSFSFIEVPKILDFYTVNYGDRFISKSELSFITVENATSYEDAYNLYVKGKENKVFLKKVLKVQLYDTSEQELELDSSVLSDREHMLNFIQFNTVDASLSEALLSYI
jgi:DNA repair exonuclease SbcCD nuclease subunit